MSHATSVRTILTQCARPLRLTSSARVQTLSLTSRRCQSSIAASTARTLQTWQAFLLGSLTVISLQGVLLYSQMPATEAGESHIRDKKADLQMVLRRLDASNVEWSTAGEVLTGLSTAQGTTYAPSLPLAAVYPTSTDDVVTIVKACKESQIPLLPVSGRTSLEGHTIALQEKGSAILVCLDKMDQILDVNAMNGDAVVQAGVTWEGLNEHLADQNIPLFFPIDPGPGAAFGGMIGAGGSGTGAVRYGTMKSEFVINATVVLPSGDVIKTRSRARKSAMGWDATKLFVGAEGTLGIVTECTVRLAPKQPVKVATTSFNSVGDAVRTVVELLNKGVQLTCVELLDDVTMKAINLSGQIARKYPEVPHLFIKFSGGPGAMADNVKMTNEVLKRHKGQPLSIARNEEENEEIWAARKGIFFSQQLLVPGCKVYITDCCVPLSRLPELVEETAKDIAASGLIAPILGHSGDGNIHAAILYREDQSYDDVKALARRLSDRAIAFEGTASGEHGVGQSKRDFMDKELGSGTVELMRTIKKAIDPDDLFNPGKMLPD